MENAQAFIDQVNTELQDESYRQQQSCLIVAAIKSGDGQLSFTGDNQMIPIVIESIMEQFGTVSGMGFEAVYRAVNEIYNNKLMMNAGMPNAGVLN